MGKETDIEWCDSTLNLQMGCDGCELWNRRRNTRHCYAGALTDVYAGLKGWPKRFEEPAIFLDRLGPALRWRDLTGQARPGKPWLDGMPRLIFLNDMGDTFTESLAIDWLGEALPLMAASPHQWLILTKRPRRMADFSRRFPLPANVWPGTSLTTQCTIGRAYDLRHVQGGGPRWLSVEPLLELLTMRDLLEVAKDRASGQWVRSGFRSLIDWVILGGESGPGARPMRPQWATRVCEECSAASVPFFFKQWGGTNKRATGRELGGREWNGMPALGLKGIAYHGA